MVSISIIIPTLNEEECLPALLKSIKRQTFKDFEVIVSDSNSEDRTEYIAKEFGAKVVKGSRKGPGAARNVGARIANGEVLFFIDADTSLGNKNMLKKLKRICKKRDVVAGLFEYKPQDGNPLDKVLYMTSNIISRITIMLNRPLIAGICFFVKKDVFERVGGFNESLVFCEDHDLSLRIKKSVPGRFVFIDSTVFNSLRRLRKDGYFKTLKTYLHTTLYFFIFKKVPRSKFKFVPSTAEH